MPLVLLGAAPALAQKAPLPASAAPPAGSVGGMGDINLFPKRVVISERERTATVGLFNRAAASGEYEISIGDMMMQPDGRLVDLASVTDPAKVATVKTASSMLRWSPRRVTLPPNEAQMVRIMVRLPAGLAPGEYRAHFSAVSVPPQDDGIAIEGEAKVAPGSVGVRIIPRFGIAIPVIVRVGATTLTSGLKNIAFTRGPAGGAIGVTITRAGNRSSFGDILVTAPGVKGPVGQLRGIGVYTELAERRVELALDPQAKLAKGTKLTVSYIDDDAEPGKVLASESLLVP